MRSKPIELTREQEIREIKAAMEDSYYLGNGSSRVVFSIQGGKVIKVAFDKAGQLQNRVEVENYLEFGGKHLAKLHAYGEWIVIQEEVLIPMPFYEVNDEYDYVMSAEYDGERVYEIGGYTESMIEGAFETIEFLNENLGWTSDNEQVGIRVDDCSIVSYDYGFNPDIGSRSVSDDLRDFLREDLDGEHDRILEFTLGRIELE